MGGGAFEETRWWLPLALLMTLLLGWRRSDERHFRAHKQSPGGNRRATRRVALLAGAACALTILLAACGGGGGPRNIPIDPATPAGTYTISVTGTTSTGASQSMMLSLTVE